MPLHAVLAILNEAGVQFDWTLNVGHLVEFLSFLVSAVFVFFRLDKRLSLLQLEFELFRDEMREKLGGMNKNLNKTLRSFDP